jgi:hypothetical protein
MMRAPGRLSPRRKALLATMATVLLLMAVLGWLGVAGFSGTRPAEMDWNHDGRVTRLEILQGYTLVVVDGTVEGQRTCRRYAWLGDRANPFRVDCRTEVRPGAAQ